MSDRATWRAPELGLSRVRDGDLRLRNHGVRRVADDAAERGAIDLRERGGGDGEAPKDGKGADAPDRS